MTTHGSCGVLTARLVSSCSLAVHTCAAHFFPQPGGSEAQVCTAEQRCSRRRRCCCSCCCCHHGRRSHSSSSTQSSSTCVRVRSPAVGAPLGRPTPNARCSLGWLGTQPSVGSSRRSARRRESGRFTRRVERKTRKTGATVSTPAFSRAVAAATHCSKRPTSASLAPAGRPSATRLEFVSRRSTWTATTASTRVSPRGRCARTALPLLFAFCHAL